MTGDATSSSQAARILVPADAAAEVLCCEQGLSFWGGVDPDTGVIIDVHHPQHGLSLAGRIVLMATSRGSCSGSGVLLQLARNGKAPAALVFHEAEDILTLGALIAQRLFDRSVAVLRLSPDLYRCLSRARSARIEQGFLRFDDREIALLHCGRQDLELNAMDHRMLAGDEGAATKVAMEILCRMAVAQQATSFVDVTRAHIDGCILAHDANLDFAEMMAAMGARTRIPTTINAISVDRENWRFQGVALDFGDKASRLADAYVEMGARPTFTCAPYLLEDVPGHGEAIGWSESNAVVFANSVLGARTEKHPDYLDLFIAMTGRAPATGVYLEANRRPQRELRVQISGEVDDAFWPMLGWLAGIESPDRVPVITGLESMPISRDDLKALCAAFATTSASPLLHLRGHTPEGELEPEPGADRIELGRSDLLRVWREFNVDESAIDLVAIGSPHASLDECCRFADLLGAQRCHHATEVIITIGRGLRAAAAAEGILQRLEQAGVRVIADLCWCSMTEPVFPPGAKRLMTNSGKYAHYARALTGCEVRFGSLADCALAACSGSAPQRLPQWLS